jgi:hypothetical protein
MNELNQQLLKQWTDAGHQVSEFMDEYHSFHDLYTQRMYLTALAFNSNPSIAWKSKEHSDDSMFPGYFIVGINTPQGQYTYHYKLKYWDLFKVTELDRAPEWDGHTSKDVTRLLSVNLCLQTYDVYTVSQESSLLYFLDGGVQEEVLLPVSQILDHLKGTKEYDTFVEAINPNAIDCLLTMEW